METIDESKKTSRALTYGTVDSSVVFKLAWYVVASKPGVLLNQYSEAESQIFKGTATFSTKLDNRPALVRIQVNGDTKSAEVAVLGASESTGRPFVDGALTQVQNSMNKYAGLSEDAKTKLRRALLAKTCWDRVVHAILNKAPSATVYFHLAHGREMLIKATEGEEVNPSSLTTASWLTIIEPLPKDAPLPSHIASELAKKSVEWKKDTQALIARYL